MATKRKSSGNGGKRSSRHTSRTHSAHQRTRRGSSSHSRRSHTNASSRATTNHEEIRRWAEQRNAVPACVRGTGNGKDTGIIRLEFPGAPNAKDESLQEISWDEFFDKFDDNNLMFLYQESTSSGQQRNFSKLVHREAGMETASSGRSSTRKSSARASSRSRQGKGSESGTGAEIDYDEDVETDPLEDEEDV